MRTDADHAIDAAYLWAGYEIPSGQLASITPYLQFDYHDNPETVNDESLGGDNEAGLTDNGVLARRRASEVLICPDGSALGRNFASPDRQYRDAAWAWPP